MVDALRTPQSQPRLNPKTIFAHANFEVRVQMVNDSYAIERNYHVVAETLGIAPDEARQIQAISKIDSSILFEVHQGTEVESIITANRESLTSVQIVALRNLPSLQIAKIHSDTAASAKKAASTSSYFADAISELTKYSNINGIAGKILKALARKADQNSKKTEYLGESLPEIAGMIEEATNLPLIKKSLNTFNELLKHSGLELVSNACPIATNDNSKSKVVSYYKLETKIT